MELSELTPGVVAVTRRGDIAIILEHKPSRPKYPVSYCINAKGKRYKGAPHEFTKIVGQVNVTEFLATCKNPPGVVNNDAVAYFLVPPQLKGVKIGDTIKIRGRSGEESVEYRGYNRNCPKNCLSIRKGGKDYKGPLSILVPATSGAPT